MYAHESIFYAFQPRRSNVESRTTSEASSSRSSRLKARTTCTRRSSRARSRWRACSRETASTSNALKTPPTQTTTTTPRFSSTKRGEKQANYFKCSWFTCFITHFFVLENAIDVMKSITEHQMFCKSDTVRELRHSVHVPVHVPLC